MGPTQDPILDQATVQTPEAAPTALVLLEARALAADPAQADPVQVLVAKERIANTSL